MWKYKLTVIAVALPLVGCHHAIGDTLHAVNGHVVDAATASAIPGVVVTVEYNGQGGLDSTVTDSSGYYAYWGWYGVPKGQLHFRHTGYREAVIDCELASRESRNSVRYLLDVELVANEE